MKVSIIIPSSLHPRKHQASNPEDKLIRAVNSALKQDYNDIEVIVIADGCKKTWFLMAKTYGDQPELQKKLRVNHIAKQPLFSGNVRNEGIDRANGDIICYLDADDYLAPDHVSTIVKHFTGQWVWFNDMTLQGDEFKERECSLKLGMCGTSNIAHLRSMKARWLPVNRYGYDDWNFIQELQKESPDGVKIETPAYIVCHIPFRRGYDV
jgi:glycosyltransferase involved in cell wall biosynthesis